MPEPNQHPRRRLVALPSYDFVRRRTLYVLRVRIRVKCKEAIHKRVLGFCHGAYSSISFKKPPWMHAVRAVSPFVATVVVREWN